MARAIRSAQWIDLPANLGVVHELRCSFEFYRAECNLRFLFLASYTVVNGRISHFRHLVDARPIFGFSTSEGLRTPSSLWKMCVAGQHVMGDSTGPIHNCATKRSRGCRSSI